VELLGGFGDLGLGNEGEQTSFLDADDAPMPMPEAKGTSGPKGGRPKGARNRSTEEWRSFVLSKYRSPLVFLAEMWSRTPAQLAAELGLYKFHEGKLVTAPIIDAEGRVMRDEEGHELRQPVLATGEAAAMQQAAAIAALPYLHQKQPLAIETKSETRGLLLLGAYDTGGDQAAGDGAVPFAPIVENQQVTDVEAEKSHAPQSHDAPNPLEYRDE